MKPLRKDNSGPRNFPPGGRGPCGKFAFSNKKDAKASLRSTREYPTSKLKPGVLQVYRCPFCH